MAQHNVDLQTLSPAEQRIYKLYGKLPTRSDLLTSKLNDRKYFDSGDYAMSKAIAAANNSYQPETAPEPRISSVSENTPPQSMQDGDSPVDPLTIIPRANTNPEFNSHFAFGRNAEDIYGHNKHSRTFSSSSDSNQCFVNTASCFSTSPTSPSTRGSYLSSSSSPVSAGFHRRPSNTPHPLDVPNVGKQHPSPEIISQLQCKTGNTVDCDSTITSISGDGTVLSVPRRMSNVNSFIPPPGLRESTNTSVGSASNGFHSVSYKS
ncbi:hypothetical protein NADFUDRAFT_81301 [Nadsonia fulvescens var. elongata DSM 6958]|uniref:mRNA stability protein n=1 Tax=Nadsonia fulvescens var. elongata DSM 6958 TaxID=857566 RepID=A0A1E3PSQ7_9ASCO|nr:hypothetical protein NADFUDRAFT_81301 [Nadsonia fulvescens var. elongata DSM 6958]